MLAIHLLNYTSDNTDLLLVPELALGTSDMAAATGTAAPVGYMIAPTPGGTNVRPDQVFSGFVQDTQTSVAGGFYDQPFTVEITSATPAPPSATRPTAACLPRQTAPCMRGPYPLRGPPSCARRLFSRVSFPRTSRRTPMSFWTAC